MENEFEVVEVEEEEEEEEKEDGGGEKKFEDSIVRFSRPLAWVLGNNWWPKASSSSSSSAPSSSSSSPPSLFFQQLMQVIGYLLIDGECLHYHRNASLEPPPPILIHLIAD